MWGQAGNYFWWTTTREPRKGSGPLRLDSAGGRGCTSTFVVVILADDSVIVGSRTSDVLAARVARARVVSEADRLSVNAPAHARNPCLKIQQVIVSPYGMYLVKL